MKLSFSGVSCGLVLAAAFAVRAQNYDTNNVEVQTFAGSGFYGYYDGVGARTMFYNPGYVVADADGNVYVLDIANDLIRKITPDGVVTTWFSLPGLYGSSGLTFDRSSNPKLLVATGAGILRISNDGFGYITPAAPATPSGICVDSANSIYISSTAENRIYRFKNGQWEVFAGSGNVGSVDGNWIFSGFSQPTAMAAGRDDSIYCWDSGSSLLRKITQQQDVISLTTPPPGSWWLPSDGTNADAYFPYVGSLCLDTNDNLFLACGTAVRKLTPDGVATTLAGSFVEAGYTNGPGSSARFRNATGICLSKGNLYVADYADHRIRKITFTQPLAVPGANLQLSLYPGLQITGAAGKNCRIESSTNLIDWKAEATLAVTHSPQFWVDSAPASSAVKTYRAVILP